mmetsp:Transcript_55504/g.180023  ORF Transcript_55504/g.180023 Transcript_55504/m.180023 type:complete len:210 (+) Transcript_55504:105-734(+)
MLVQSVPCRVRVYVQVGVWRAGCRRSPKSIARAGRGYEGHATRSQGLGGRGRGGRSEVLRCGCGADHFHHEGDARNAHLARDIAGGAADGAAEEAGPDQPPRLQDAEQEPYDEVPQPDQEPEGLAAGLRGAGRIHRGSLLHAAAWALGAASGGARRGAVEARGGSADPAGAHRQQDRGARQAWIRRAGGCTRGHDHLKKWACCRGEDEA